MPKMTYKSMDDYKVIEMPEPVIWEEADEVRAIAEDLINDLSYPHNWLRNARIAYLFRMAKSWQSKGREIWAKTYKLSGFRRYLARTDLVVVVNPVIWMHTDHARKVALVDHELSHCQPAIDSSGNIVKGQYRLVPHDVEGFTGVASRHGAWVEEIEDFVEATKQGEQLKLFMDKQQSKAG